MRRVLWGLGHVWMLPFSAAGLLMTVIGGAHFRELSYDGALHCVADPRGLVRRFFANNNRWAMTWGAVIVFRDDAIMSEPTIVRHEHIHVRQMMVLGALFPALYFLASLWAKVRGGDFYFNNYFEERAYAGQG